MKNKFLATIGTAAFALGMSVSASFAGYFVPGETMGVSLDSPLPEGVFFADLETYGRADTQPDLNVGVNIPVVIWSTPFSFYNNRVEILAAFPFVHFDGAQSAGISDRVGAVTFALGPILAHDFGGGLTGGVSAFVRTPTPSQNIRSLDLRTATEGDFRESLQYVIPTGVFSGITLIENAGVTSALGQSNFHGVNDMFAGDFTIEKTFGKFTIGATGFGNIDIDNRQGSLLGVNTRQASVELGGLIAYDFGRFSLTGIVTRTVYENQTGVSATLAGLVSGRGYETRGWVRAIVPLYVAPTAPAPVVARY